jgi:2-oxoglutarate ferredoxin oxidoreductase subunit alpha
MSDRVFIKGNEAIAEAAVRAGCRFFAGYPITPQNEIPEYLSRRMPEVGGVFVQGESEVASVNMVYGAACTGTRCMTSSSSCGIALKSEGIAWLAASSLPSVVVNVSRGGPGIGSIQPSQMDYHQATKASGNGGFRMLVLAPGTVQEAVDMTYAAFDYADKYRKPVLVLADGFIGAMMEPVVLPPMKSDEEIAAIRETKKGWAAIGKKGGPAHNILGGVGLSKLRLQDLNMKDAELYENWKATETEAEEYMTDDAEYIMTGYGTSARIGKSAVSILRSEGLKFGFIRPKKLYPFPEENFLKLDYSRVKGIMCVEMSIPAQYTEDVENIVAGRAPIRTSLRSGGEIIERIDILDAARLMAKEVL